MVHIYYFYEYCLSANDGVEVTMNCKEFLIVGGSAGTQVGTNEGNMVSLLFFLMSFFLIPANHSSIY